MGWQQTANDTTEVQVSSDMCTYLKSSGVSSFVRFCSSMRKMGIPLALSNLLKDGVYLNDVVVIVMYFHQ